MKFHVGCIPLKFQSYDRLVEFLKMISNKSIATGGELQNRETIAWINQEATKLLKELGE